MRRLMLQLLLSLSCAVMALPCLADQADDNVAVVRSMTEALNARDFDALDGLISPDVVRHCAATPGVNVSNLEEMKQFLKADLAACPDATQEINMIFGAGDKVAAHVTYRGTQTGQMGPFPASGKPVELPFIGILRLEDGLVAEIWVEWDNMHALTQLGHLEPPQAEKSTEDE